VTPPDPTFLAAAQALATALAVGLLVGLERGWRDRELPEGRRVAGLRTFALIGLLGGVLTLLPSEPGVLPSAGLLALAAFFLVSYRQASRASGSLSVTTAIAGLVTFGLGALAAGGRPLAAVAAAVVVALLLDLKPVLHGWLRLIRPAELIAVLQLGVLSAVVLPLLPDAGYGPYEALNPFRLWLAVVLIAALSLLGHVAVRMRGESQGLLWTGLLGGLASSTAATLALARTARSHPAWSASVAAAIIASNGVMFARMAVLALVLQPTLAPGLSTYLLLLAVLTFILAALRWRRRSAAGPSDEAPHGRPFDLPTAIGFGVVLGVVAVASRAAQAALGDAGLFAVAFVAGLADVDAILISSVQLLAQGMATPSVTATTVLLAAAANMVAKGSLAWGIAGRAVGVPVVTAFMLVGVAGGLALALAR
jgi:uncharacterized membrane protein (DUF4010 family)